MIGKRPICHSPTRSKGGKEGTGTSFNAGAFNIKKKSRIELNYYSSEKGKIILRSGGKRSRNADRETGSSAKPGVR